MDVLKGKKIVLGVCGGIAAYKAILLTRLLVDRGAEVTPVLTEAAHEFVTELTFSTLAQRPALTGLWDPSAWVRHVHLAHEADLIVIAPATTNTIAKLATGQCDNLLTALCLSATCPVLVCPAMDREMYAHPATQANYRTLTSYGYHLLDSEEGFLASGLSGKGRLADPVHIVAEIERLLTPKELADLRVLVNAGPTREPIDAVRYISNHSTGKMGIALADAATALGARVTLVLGPTDLRPRQPTVQVVPVSTARQMAEQTLHHAQEADLIVLSAAVADYAPRNVALQKIKKQDSALQIDLQPTQDILKTLGETKQPRQTLIGFALETHQALAYGLDKLKRKKADGIVLNTLEDPGSGFGHDTNKIILLSHVDIPLELPMAPKRELAFAIWKWAKSLHDSKKRIE
jgi:phosphopantothenoylcysteine decarboxylase/phosphopantothenate--cysteine ligase